MARHKKQNRVIVDYNQIGLIRIIIALLIAGIGGWLSFALAVSGVARSKNPQVALNFFPIESTALAARSDQLFVVNPAKPSPLSGRLAKSALKQQAFNPRALRLLGYISDIKGDSQQAFVFIKMAEKLSRREAGAQLWLIEYSAQAGDTAKTLHHYDILLTTKPDTQALLFPRLSEAIEDQSIRTALLPYMRQDRPWVSSFLSYATSNSKDLTGLVNLISEAKGYPKNASARPLALSLISRLVGEQRFGEAKRIYYLLPDAKASRLTNPDFDDADRNGQFGTMGWQIPDDPNAGGGFVGKAGQGKPVLSIFANSATTQLVASRLLYLKPGSYRFSTKISELEKGDGGYARIPTALSD